VDLRERRIPNLVTYPLLALALVARPGGLGLVPIEHVLTALVAFALFAGFSARGWMGMGDAKLAAVIGLASGPGLGLLALWLAFLLGGLYGIALLVTGRATRRDAVPFGPFLAVAGVLAALAPETLLERSPFWRLFSG